MITTTTLLLAGIALWAIWRDRVRFIFAWYDLWVGFYWNRQTRDLYILPLPTLGIVVNFK